MNLQLYIPPRSAHPPGVTQGAIIGLIKTYWETNTNLADFITHASNLYMRFAKRGYPIPLLNTLFTKACNRLTRKKEEGENEDYRRQLFFHLLYHPKGIERTNIRQAYEQTLKAIVPNRKFTVAISQPRNLRDKLCRSKLAITNNNNNPSDFILAGTSLPISR